MDEGQLQNLWDDILSRQPERIRRAYARLAPDEQQAISDHLFRMVNEPGWHPEQRQSAQVALQALKENPR